MENTEATAEAMEHSDYREEKPRAFAAARALLTRRCSSAVTASFGTPALCSVSDAYFRCLPLRGSSSSSGRSEQVLREDRKDDGYLFRRAPHSQLTTAATFDFPASDPPSFRADSRSISPATGMTGGFLDPPLNGSGSASTFAHAVARLETDANSTTTTTTGSTIKGGVVPVKSLAEAHDNDDEHETIAQLTSLVLDHLGATNSDKNRKLKELYPDIGSAHTSILSLGAAIPRRVCQHPFRRNDIVWVCRTCQSDETCVLCHECYIHSNHEGHDVAFYHAQAGGCCDCGDPDAWDPRGFCSRHGPDVANADARTGMDNGVVQRAGGTVEATADWLVGTIANGVERGYSRANPRRGRTLSRAISMPLSDNGRNPGGVSALKVRRRYYEEETTSDNSDSVEHELGQRQYLEQVSDNLLEDSASSSSLNDAREELHSELSFNPEAASTSKSQFNVAIIETTHSSTLPSFDPEAASTSKSYLRQKLTTDTAYHARLSKTPVLQASPAQLLGEIGSAQHGLYLILHADDIHTISEVTAALRELYSAAAYSTHNTHSEAILTKAARLLHHHGDLIVWGTHELIAQLGPGMSALWRDGDRLASTRFGASILEKARILSRHHGLVCSIKTREELRMEQRAAAVISWLSTLARSCDPLCHCVSVAISGPRHLVPLLHTDLKLPRTITTAWHALLLTLLAVPSFKADLANAYCDTYRAVTAEYARGVGILDRSSYTLSVQFLNRVTYVQDLVRERDLLGTLSRSLLETLTVAVKKKSLGNSTDGVGSSLDARSSPPWQASPDDYLSPWTALVEDVTDMAAAAVARRAVRHPSWYTEKTESSEPSEPVVLTLNPNHPVLSHRRYSPCISDLKCVLNVPGMARLFASLPATTAREDKTEKNSAAFVEPLSCLDGWIQSLSLGQNMDEQVWRSSSHVETEPRGWVGAFNASISLGSLYERLLSWEDDDLTHMMDIGGESIASNRLLTAAELTYYLLTTGISSWQASKMLSYHSTSNSSALVPNARCPASLPMSTVSFKHGAALATRALPVAQISHWSFHLPLHRFLAACLREVNRRPCLEDDGAGGMDELLTRLGRLENTHQLNLLFRGLIEFPVIVLSRAAQVRSGLWKRNGPGMQDQVLNYSEPPFCKGLRDADLLQLQFAMLGCDILNSNTNPNSHLTEEVGASDFRIASIGCAHFVNLLLHRFGVFDFAGFLTAPNLNRTRYLDEINRGLYDREKAENEENYRPGDDNELLSLLVFPWTFTPAKDSSTCLSLLEELLHLLIILITELPPPPPQDKADHTIQAKHRLRREVIHRLVSGPKTHSELAEVHHVLPQSDNMILIEEGRLVNPDDATGAALEAALAEVAERKSIKGKLAPDQWELRKWVWAEYDPAFFHVSLRNHQSAAENRNAASSLTNSQVIDRLESRPFAPRPPYAHRSFLKIRKALTADSCVMTLIYRTLHVHCRRVPDPDRDMTDLRGMNAYEHDAMSETVLARAVHLLTLGAYSWNEPVVGLDDELPPGSWRTGGGGERGSIFYHCINAPTANDWVEKTLLANPWDIMDCEWYIGEDTALILLNRLANDGGCSNGFVAQDRSIRDGAAWICQFAARFNPVAASLLGKRSIKSIAESSDQREETEMQRRRREAKERALKQMQSSMTKFAKMVDAAEDEMEQGKKPESIDFAPVMSNGQFTGSRRPLLNHNESLEAEISTLALPLPPSDTMRTNDASGGESSMETSEYDEGNCRYTNFQNHFSRLLKERPQCVICVDDGQNGLTANTVSSSMNIDINDSTIDRDGSKGGSDNALAFCGYAQASTVLKGGGGVPASASTMNYMTGVRRFVGTHIALCGHALHSSCCESYLKTVAQREDRSIGRIEGGKRGEFKCPLCQRLSNCLVPFIDVGCDWVDPPQTNSAENAKNVDNESALFSENGENHSANRNSDLFDIASLCHFLSQSKWWASLNDSTVVWDGRCTFLPADKVSAPQSPAPSENGDVTSIVSSSSRMSLRKSVRSFGKKDLCMAWNSVMRTPRFVRRRRNSAGSDSLSNDGRRAPSHEDGPRLLRPTSPLVMRSEPSGATDVWRRLMDQLAEVSYRADLKRLGEERLTDDYGEFRHYLVEKAAFNSENRAAGKEIVDWPICISTTTLSDSRRQELSREKLISKLFLSIQAFTYSCCSEAAEVKRLARKSFPSADILFPSRNQEVWNLYAKYGVDTLLLGEELLVLPKPLLIRDAGTQLFDGRIGKLRYLALAVMVATSAVAREIVQLSLEFPISRTFESSSSSLGEALPSSSSSNRAPIVYPLLCGHILTHVVASMCATCGRARAESDSLDGTLGVISTKLIADFSSGSEITVGNIASDCVNFIKLGFLARTLQSLLGQIQSSLVRKKADGSVSTPSHYQLEYHTMSAVEAILKNTDNRAAIDDSWEHCCCLLLRMALTSSDKVEEAVQTNAESFELNPTDLESILLEACSVSRRAAFSYLVDVVFILQVLSPGIVYSMKVEEHSFHDEDSQSNEVSTIFSIMNIESFREMLNSRLVFQLVNNWYENSKPQGVIFGMKRRLDCDRTFRVNDWPVVALREPSMPNLNCDQPNLHTASPEHGSHSSHKLAAASLLDEDVSQTDGGLHQKSTFESQLIDFNSSVSVAPLSGSVCSPKQTVPLLGGSRPRESKNGSGPCINMLPTSYTDLYAELGALCPDSEQTALCLVCGLVLNAGGKGECTRHAVECGGGSGIFFLLQECIGLIMHGVRAAYVHSPYVDSHGETPQYRGRPLNLDLDRYDVLHELWSGHLVKQKVIAERGNSRQVIIGNFY